MFNLNAFAKGYKLGADIKEARKNKRLEEAQRKLKMKQVTEALNNYDEKRAEEEKRKQEQYKYEEEMQNIKLKEAKENSATNSLARSLKNKQYKYENEHFDENAKLKENQNKLANLKTKSALENFNKVEAQNIELSNVKVREALGKSRYNNIQTAAKLALVGDLAGAHDVLEREGMISGDDRIEQIDGGILITDKNGEKVKINVLDLSKTAGGEKFKKDYEKISNAVANISKLNYEMNAILRGQESGNDTSGSSYSLNTTGTSVKKYNKNEKQKHIFSEVRRLLDTYPQHKDFIIKMLMDSDLSDYIPKDYLPKQKAVDISQFDSTANVNQGNMVDANQEGGLSQYNSMGE